MLARQAASLPWFNECQRDKRWQIKQLKQQKACLHFPRAIIFVTSPCHACCLLPSKHGEDVCSVCLGYLQPLDEEHQTYFRKNKHSDTSDTIVLCVFPWFLHSCPWSVSIHINNKITSLARGILEVVGMQKSCMDRLLYTHYVTLYVYLLDLTGCHWQTSVFWGEDGYSSWTPLKGWIAYNSFFWYTRAKFNIWYTGETKLGIASQTIPRPQINL